MSETLASRVKRLVSGSANMIVTTVENMAPEMVMEESIREIDKGIADVRTELGQVLTRQYHASQRLSAENKRHEEVSDKIQIALKEGREDLAETGVAQLLDIEAQIPILDAAVIETREAEAELESFIGALQGRKREMEQELQEFRSASSMATATAAVKASSSSVHQRVAEAEATFDRVMTRAGGIALGDKGVDPKTARAQAELEDLARQNRIKERLAALKKA